MSGIGAEGAEVGVPAWSPPLPSEELREARAQLAREKAQAACSKGMVASLTAGLHQVREDAGIKTARLENQVVALGRELVMLREQVRNTTINPTQLVCIERAQLRAMKQMGRILREDTFRVRLWRARMMESGSVEDARVEGCRDILKTVAYGKVANHTVVMQHWLRK